VVARRSWAGLTGREKREVLRCAKRGKHHPNGDIAQAACSWAEQTLALKWRTGWLALPIALLDSAAGGGWLGISIAERRAAKRILRLGPTSGRVE
jgi:hypothetical protein